MPYRVSLLLASLSLAACGDDGGPSGDAGIPLPANYVYVTDGAHVHVFDPDTFARVVDLEVGGGSNEIHATPDGSLVWILSTDANEVTLFDTATLMRTTLPVGVRPVHSFISPDHAEIWVGNDGSGNVSVIDVASRAVATTVLTGAGHHKMAMVTDVGGAFTFAYVSNITDGSITPVGADHVARANVTGVGPGPHGMDFDATTGYVLNCAGDVDAQTEGSQPGIELIATRDDPGAEGDETATVVHRVPLAAGRCGYLHAEDGFAYFSLGSAGLVGRMNVATREVTTFPAGMRPDKIEVVGDHLFAANVITPTVTVVSLTGGALETIETGNPVEPGTSPTGGHRSLRLHDGRLYVPNAFDGSVTVIDATTRAVVGTLTGMEHPSNVAVAGPSGGSTYPR
jgi:YVTN family beta-propeller protein